MGATQTKAVERIFQHFIDDTALALNVWTDAALLAEAIEKAKADCRKEAAAIGGIPDIETHISTVEAKVRKKFQADKRGRSS